MVIRQHPFIDPAERNIFNNRGQWPCRWIACPKAGPPPFVTAYRRKFKLAADATIRAHVSADERYELFVDGRRIGRGPERGDFANWFYETYDIPLKKGKHVIVARVWSLGEIAPYAQLSIESGFIFAPEEPFTKLLGTGVSGWQAKKLGGYGFVTRPFVAFTGPRHILDGAQLDWGVEHGLGGGWKTPIVRHAGLHAHLANQNPITHLMRPAMLPGMIEEPRHAGTTRLVIPVDADPREQRVDSSANIPEEQKQWNLLLQGVGSVTIPPHSKRRVIIDLRTYLTYYPTLLVSGGQGASIRLGYAEALFKEPPNEEWHYSPFKSNRNDVEGLLFVGPYDTFKPDGGDGRRFDVLWWEAGRYIEAFIETAEHPLTIDELSWRETRYPLEMEASFSSDDPRLGKVIAPALRALQVCSQETYMDCAYYEQLMYAGDTRTEILTTYCLTHDDRLPRKALYMFHASRLITGFTQSRFPSRTQQIIPPFCLFWINALYDFAMWRGDDGFVRQLLPTGRLIIDAFLASRNKDGLIAAPSGWNFYDWVVGWDMSGTPPEGEFGVSGPINWHLPMTLGHLAQLEDHFGERELAARWRRLADEQAAASQAFWDPARRLYSEDLAHRSFSEHTQCLAILSGKLDAGRIDAIKEPLRKDELFRTTIYFDHYLFEAYRVLGEIGAIVGRMGPWFGLEKNGLFTTPEQPEPCRSDCHAWGAHPLYHYFATFLGIRPASFSFKSAVIAPQFGPLTRLTGSLPHPAGFIAADLSRDGQRLTGQITLPDGIPGELQWSGQTRPLSPGANAIDIG